MEGEITGTATRNANKGITGPSRKEDGGPILYRPEDYLGRSQIVLENQAISPLKTIRLSAVL